jgi:hypothetical protein
LVDALKTLDKDGIIVNGTRVHARLLLESSDLPATRKLAGFASHAARKGCSVCKKECIINAFNGREWGHMPYLGAAHDPEEDAQAALAY